VYAECGLFMIFEARRNLCASEIKSRCSIITAGIKMVSFHE